MTKWIRVIVFLISFLLLASSLTQSAYYVEGSGESVGSFSLVAFLLGWVVMLGAGISWLANPILFFSWITMLRRKRKAAIILSILAVAFALSFLLFDEVVANEGGGKRDIVGYGAGYWLWLSSCGVNLIGNLALNALNNKKAIAR